MFVCSVVGLMVVGAMAASMIGITTPIEFEQTGLVLQEVIDGILPQALNLGVTFLMYGLVRRGTSTKMLLTICILGGVIVSALGILA